MANKVARIAAEGFAGDRRKVTPGIVKGTRAGALAYVKRTFAGCTCITSGALYSLFDQPIVSNSVTRSALPLHVTRGPNYGTSDPRTLGDAARPREP